MRKLFLKKDNLKIFADALAEGYHLYYIQKGREDRLHLVEFEEELRDAVVGEVRPFEPLKNFFFSAREKVVDGYEASKKVEEAQDKPLCILGVKNCDLAGLNITDFVFREGDVKDPFYTRNRERNLIVAADCTKAVDTCFCHAIGHRHYPERNYDILISELHLGFLLEAATAKGGAFLEARRDMFDEAGDKHREERDHIRRRAGDQVERNIKEHEIPRHTDFENIIKENIDSEIWGRETKACVECGCCNVICPTCHCFYLMDSRRKGGEETRYRIWDSCMHKRFAAVAGGANPRGHLSERLRNRFEKKFDFFPQVSGRYACTGCGRCYSGCPAKIDIRKVLKELVAEKKAGHQTR